MKYYSINNVSDDLEIIGHYPQLALKRGYNPTLSDSYKQVKANNFPDFVPNLELELHPKANPTDFLPRVGPYFGIFVNEKMKDVLENHNLPRHHFYPIKIFKSDIALNYFWLHYIVDDFWNYLDIESSYAELKKMVDPVTYVVDKKIPIQSRDQIIKEDYKQKGTDILAIGQIKMKRGFPKYDLYQVDCLSYNTIISEALKEALLTEGLTGFETKPFDRFEVNS
ncbi:hypothetical protein [Aquimarina macrocephali]|uniref:hypothetical protein n=1 Tax=Aquimarina macrocephali TaxID=666563 RepID=UPI000467C159|nr:hypothetical protein [Aquimarina macrocephali]